MRLTNPVVPKALGRIALLGALVAAAATPALAQRTAPSPQLTPDELANIRVYEAANASVVHIRTSTVQRDRMWGVAYQGQGAGSGAVIDKLGHIVTNHHVIENAREIKVTFADDQEYDAVLIGSDEIYDLAVIRVDAPSAVLEPLALGRSDSLRVGQKAYALGNPFGLDGTLTSGVVSSLNRSLPSQVEGRTMSGLIQTDAAMNPGNSGGPLLNTSAQMIGMCVAIRSSVGQNSGVGFAIPIDRIRRFLPELIETGRVVRADPGIEVFYETPNGLRIAKLSRGGAADSAGLRGFRVVERRWREGAVVYRDTRVDREHADYILEVDGQPVTETAEFLELMDGYKPGQEAVFTVRRDGDVIRVPIVLGSA